LLPALLWFSAEDGGDMFSRNVDWLSRDYTAKKPACTLLHTGALLGLFFDSEDAGDMFNNDSNPK
jgi:hypothetical protein